MGLVAGFRLHGLVPMLMGPYAGLIVFTLLVWGVYVLFLDAMPQSRLVMWDDTCGFCRGWIAWLRRLDWLRVHRFEGSSRPEALAEAGVSAAEASDEIKVRVDGPDRRRLRGHRAILECCRWGFCGRVRWRFRRSAGSGRGIPASGRRRHCLLPPLILTPERGQPCAAHFVAPVTPALSAVPRGQSAGPCAGLAGAAGPETATADGLEVFDLEAAAGRRCLRRISVTSPRAPTTS